MIDDIPHEIFYSSLHERPLRDELTKFTTTTKQFMTAKKNEPALKVIKNDYFMTFTNLFQASQLLKVIHRICPAAKEAFEVELLLLSLLIFEYINSIKKYLIESRGKVADIDRLVNIVSQTCKSEDIRAIINDFIDQVRFVSFSVLG